MTEMKRLSDRETERLILSYGTLKSVCGR